MDFVSGAAVALVGAATGAFFHRWITKADRDRHEKWEFQRDAAEILGHAWRALDECNPERDGPSDVLQIPEALISSTSFAEQSTLFFRYSPDHILATQSSTMGEC